MDESTNSQSSSEQSNDNVVRFPKKNSRIVLPEEDEAIREATKRAFVDEVIERYGFELMDRFAQQGFDIYEKKFDKHFGFTMEALRSTLLSTMNLPHPFQDIIEKSVRLMGEVEFAEDDDEVS